MAENISFQSDGLKIAGLIDSQKTQRVWLRQ
jgi:hypothetical protein